MSANLSEYERQRLANIERNQKVLEALGLSSGGLIQRGRGVVRRERRSLKPKQAREVDLPGLTVVVEAHVGAGAPQLRDGAGEVRFDSADAERDGSPRAHLDASAVPHRPGRDGREARRGEDCLNTSSCNCIPRRGVKMGVQTKGRYTLYCCAFYCIPRRA